MEKGKTMTDREKLIQIIDSSRTYVADKENLADHLIANGVTITPEIPGPEIADPNIMELCFHNGERHMKEKSISLLDAFDKDYTFGDPYIEYDALRKAMMDL